MYCIPYNRYPMRTRIGSMTIDNYSADNNNLIKFNHYGDDDKMYPLKKYNLYVNVGISFTMLFFYEYLNNQKSEL